MNIKNVQNQTNQYQEVRTVSTETNTNQTLTGYQLAKAVNRKLAENGITKEIPAQMVYSYIKQGFIKSVVIGNQNRVELEEAKAWAAKFVARRLEGKTNQEVVL